MNAEKAILVLEDGAVFEGRCVVGPNGSSDAVKKPGNEPVTRSTSMPEPSKGKDGSSAQQPVVEKKASAAR